MCQTSKGKTTHGEKQPMREEAFRVRGMEVDEVDEDKARKGKKWQVREAY
jgi:hypothetical protein